MMQDEAGDWEAVRAVHGGISRGEATFNPDLREVGVG